MKINWYKIASAVQLLIGVAAIVAFFVMAFDGGDIRPWVITVTLAVVPRCVRNNGRNKKAVLTMTNEIAR